VSEYYQQITTGLVLLAAVTFDTLAKRKGTTARAPEAKVSLKRGAA
jgi:ribose/xylose/arabinose/galactoside ABC-type transport system permease subunit